jgi:cell division protein FtsI (penicillin-binding protein 3)
MTVRFFAKFEQKITILKIAFACLWIIFIGRLIWLQVVDRPQFLEAALSQQNLIIDIEAKRGAIYDINNRVLAEDIDSYSYYIVPEKIRDKAGVARTLAKITEIKNWSDKFAKHPRFLWVARKTSSELQRRLDSLPIETLGRVVEPKRTYPSGDMALALIGRVDIDNKALSGIEIRYDDLLAGKKGKAVLMRDAKGRSYQFHEEPVTKPTNGLDIILTIDFDLQQIVEQELARALCENGAKSGIAIFQRAETGEILACASLDSAGAPSNRNRAITDQYEPGSTFKMVAVAAALTSGKYRPSTIVNVENGKYRVDDRIIQDDHKYDRLTVEEVVIHSSNIGAAKLGLAMGDELMFKAIKEAGFVMPLGIDFPGEAAGEILDLTWRDHYLANVCFGHAISATPLQMVGLYSAIASGGDLYRPFIGKEIMYEDGRREVLNHVHKMRDVFPQELTKTLSGFLRQVVIMGTATKADSGVVTIAGKTGTALKLRDDKKGYDHSKAMASFVGFFPYEMPQVVGIVVFDEPKTSRYGGEMSAPVFKNIAERYSVLPMKMAGMYASGGIMENREKPSKREIKQDSVKAMTVEARVDNADLPSNAIPEFRGMTIRQALRLAQKKGIQCGYSGSGVVSEQAPSAGELYQPGMIIKLRCNGG